MKATLDLAGGWPVSMEESSECPHGAPMPPAWCGGPQEERGLGGAGRAHHLRPPLCWQPSSPCIAVIQCLVLGVQMSFQMPSAPRTRSSN